MLPVGEPADMQLIQEQPFNSAYNSVQPEVFGRKEKILHPPSGKTTYLKAIFLLLCGLVLPGILILLFPINVITIILASVVGLAIFIAGCCCCCGIYTVQPNSAYILTMFGEYKGTVKDNGIFYVNPFYTK